jgi:hypothetical protein
MSGRGRRIPTAHSSTGTPTSRATTLPAKSLEPGRVQHDLRLSGAGIRGGRRPRNCNGSAGRQTSSSTGGVASDAARAGRRSRSESSGSRKRMGIISRYACGSSAPPGSEEGVCAIRTILKRTGRNTKRAVW